MGLIDRLKGYKKEAEFTAREIAGDKRVAIERRQYKQERREQEDYEYKKRQDQAERKAKQLAVKDMEVKNKEKLKELNKRNLKAGPLGTIVDMGKRATKTESSKQSRPRRSIRQRYDNRYDNSYRPPRQRKNIDDIDREFDKFF